MSAAVPSAPFERIEIFARILSTIPGTDCGAQRDRILKAIRDLGNVTSFEASRYLDCYYPPARVFELREEGYNIKTLMRAEQTESGIFHRVGVWHLEGVTND